jgi:hypothetical protein
MGSENCVGADQACKTASQSFLKINQNLLINPVYEDRVEPHFWGRVDECKT